MKNWNYSFSPSIIFFKSKYILRYIRNNKEKCNYSLTYWSETNHNEWFQYVGLCWQLSYMFINVDSLFAHICSAVFRKVGSFFLYVYLNLVKTCLLWIWNLVLGRAEITQVEHSFKDGAHTGNRSTIYFTMTGRI